MAMLGWIERVVVVGCLITACSDDGPAGTGGESSGSSGVPGDSSGGATTAAPDGSGTSSSSGGGTSSTGSVDSSSGEAVTTTSEGSTTTSTDSTSSESTTSAGTDPPGSTSSGPMGGLPNGSACSDNGDCASNACYLAGILGGTCGECLDDSDCASGGCSIPNPLASPPQGAVCNAGLAGEGCQSDAVCVDPLVCNVILDVPGVITNATCGDCIVDGDCGAGQVCSPDYDVLGLGGVWSCVDTGSVPDGGGCDLDTSGDEACASGFCAVADVMGLLTLGVCSECEVDADCVSGTCLPPSVDISMGLVAGVCV